MKAKFVSESLNISNIEANDRIDRYLSDKEWEEEYKGHSANTYYRIINELKERGNFFIPYSGRWWKGDNWENLLDMIHKSGMDWEFLKDYKDSPSSSYSNGILIHGGPDIADDIYEILQKTDPIYLDL